MIPRGVLGPALCVAVVMSPTVMTPTAVVTAAETAAATVSADQLDFFERKIRPLLVQHCYECHSEQSDTMHAGLRLDAADGLAAGGDSGPAVVPGHPADSLLIQTVRYDGDIQMPPEGKLSEREIEHLVRWVRDGAAMPSTPATARPAAAGIDWQQGRQHWAFQPAHVQDLPSVTRSDWPRTRTDHFLLAAMERQGLEPAPPADRVTLIRRLYFDLLGLPPTPEQIDAFVQDRGVDAYQRLVDRLLASPRYGEKWGRWWLDMARYTDRTASWLPQTSHAYLYRDWVVAALNDDVPYDRFVHRQLATDLMPETGPEDLAALGFLSLSPAYWKEPKLPCEIIKTIVADEWEERVDAVSRTFLGLTVACARCHDHKFDPISSEDYYALAGVFASVRHAERPLIDEAAYEPVRKAKQRVAALEKEIQALRKQKPSAESEDAEKRQAEIKSRQAEIERIRQTTPNYDVPLVNALVEESTYVVRAGKTPEEGTAFEHRPEPRDLPAFIRGNPNRPGPIVPRRFLTVLTDQPQPFTEGSGRLELARAMTGEARSVTARVIVNRIFLAHFGRGIVATPSNFGRQGDTPSHPRLLDDLAARLIAEGWSLKWLHRELVLSAAWRQAASTSPEKLAADPPNRWLSRMETRRLDVEPWRDAVLSVSGALDHRVGGPSQPVDDANNRRRTLYATVHRRDMAATLMVHDFPDPTQHSPARSVTTTALQGLYALNGPLLLGHADRLLERLQREAGDASAAQRIERVYRLLYGRGPTMGERELGVAYVSAGDGEEAAERWQSYLHVLLAANEFMFVD